MKQEIYIIFISFTFLVNLFLNGSFVSNSSNLSAAPGTASGKNIKIIDKKTHNAGKKSASDDSTDKKNSFVKKYQPQIGILLGPIMPLGDLNKIFGTGLLNGHIFTDMVIPIKLFQKNSFNLRIGGSLGYAALRNDPPLDDKSISKKNRNDTVTHNLMPMLFYCQILYSIKNIGLFPFFDIAGGITYSTREIKRNERILNDAFSYDGTVSVALGLNYINKSLKNIVFQVKINYLRPFEVVSGNYLFFNFGIGYHF
jgi:hypothetical protein